MECFNCGSPLPEAARFCPQCGVRLTSEGAAPDLPVDAIPVSPPPVPVGPSLGITWEYCEIRLWQGYLKADFYAHALNPNGSGGDIARSSTFWWRRPDTPLPEDAPLAAHEALVKSLVDRGWEPIGEPRPWFAQRFRREVLGGDPATTLARGAPYG